MCTVLFFPSVRLWLVDLIRIVAVFYTAQCLHMKEYMIKTHVIPDMDEIIEREYLNLVLDKNMVTTR